MRCILLFSSSKIQLIWYCNLHDKLWETTLEKSKIMIRERNCVWKIDTTGFLKVIRMIIHLTMSRPFLHNLRFYQQEQMQQWFCLYLLVLLKIDEKISKILHTLSPILFTWFLSLQKLKLSVQFLRHFIFMQIDL